MLWPLGLETVYRKSRDQATQLRRENRNKEEIFSRANLLNVGGLSDLPLEIMPDYYHNEM